MKKLMSIFSVLIGTTTLVSSTTAGSGLLPGSCCQEQQLDKISDETLDRDPWMEYDIAIDKVNGQFNQNINAVSPDFEEPDTTFEQSGMTQNTVRVSMNAMETEPEKQELIDKPEDSTTVIEQQEEEKAEEDSTTVIEQEDDLELIEILNGLGRVVEELIGIEPSFDISQNN